MVLIRPSLDTLTDWHRRFAELFETLYATGYVQDYRGLTTPLVRFLPVGKAIEAHPMALPSDQLEVVLDQFEDFAVGQCQCRIAMDAVGRGCGKPKGNCAAMGRWARKSVEKGIFRRVSKREMLDIKREAEAHGMVNWFMNVAGTKSQCSCSCCGCCCHAMRTISEHNVPGMIAPPHFLPRFDPARCAFCLMPGRMSDEGHRCGPRGEDVAASPGALRGLRPVHGRLRAGKGHAPWSPCPTTSCPTGVGSRCSAGRFRRC